MSRREDPVDRPTHRKIGADLFNYTWSLLDRGGYTAEEADEMVHAAHASRYHWGSAGGPLQRSIGEWQISRVYAVLGRPEPATYHARRALEIAIRHRLSNFYLAYGHEALARARKVAGDGEATRRHLRVAQRLGSKVRDADDRRMLLEDLGTLRPPKVPFRRSRRKRPR